MQQPSRARQRLKDSCNNCALAKVKCNREKPVCSRCQDRDLACSYGLSHRSGRRRTASRILDKTVTATTTSSTAIPKASCIPPQETFNRAEFSAFLHTSSSSATEIFYGPRISVVDEGNRLSPPFTSSELGMNSDTQASSPSDMATLSYLDGDFPISVNHLCYGQSFDGQSFEQELGMLAATSAGANQLATSASIGSCLNPSPDTIASASLQQPPSDRAIVNQQPFSANPTCLLQVLGLLATLEGNAQTCPRPIADITVPSYLVYPLPMTYELSTLRTALESAMSILRCPCSTNNDQLIILVCFIGFRVMARYAAVVQEGHGQGEIFPLHSADNPMDSTIYSEQFNYHIDVERCDRAQLVLGELHHVDLLIELLSQCFEKERRDPISRGYDSGSGDDVRISISIFAQLEADLRKRRRAIANYIMINLQCI